MRAEAGVLLRGSSSTEGEFSVSQHLDLDEQSGGRTKSQNSQHALIRILKIYHCVDTIPVKWNKLDSSKHSSKKTDNSSKSHSNDNLSRPRFSCHHGRWRAGSSGCRSLTTCSSGCGCASGCGPKCSSSGSSESSSQKRAENAVIASIVGPLQALSNLGLGLVPAIVALFNQLLRLGEYTGPIRLLLYALQTQESDVAWFWQAIAA